MSARSLLRVVLPLLAVSMTGCALLRCGVKRGAGETAVGEVAAGTHSSHVLDLSEGQNDVYVTPRDTMQTGITYRAYVTSATCTSFSPHAPKWELRYPVVPQDPCAIISSDTLKRHTQISGRARFGPGAKVQVFQHEVSGATRFKLWIIGDPRVPVSYDVIIEWGSGHDC
jgi:hypothetical protein